jgi:addiction module RelE/StbE family toxin
VINKIVFTPQFEKLYTFKEKRSSKELMKKVNDGITELRYSDRPEMIGSKKKGKLHKFYSYDISYGNRILYRVERKEGIVYVQLLRVCDHKNVYSKD